MEHRDEVTAHVRKYASENKQKISERNRRYRERNPEETAERKRRDYLKHHETRIEANKRYHRTPEGLAAYSRRNHRKRADPDCVYDCTLTAGEFQKIIKIQENKCACCGRTFSDSLKPERDCIRPISSGGALEYSNVQALCGSCNSIKHSDEMIFIRIKGEKWWLTTKRYSKVLEFAPQPIFEYDNGVTTQ
jgi:5-methylcytosine-specific restriction endonuclease McrA